MPAPDPHAARDREGMEAVRKVYADLAARAPERDCALRTGCCRFALTGKVPSVTRGETLVALRALRAAGRQTVAAREDGACPMLHPLTSRCMIYEGRPFGCRTHFCDPAGGPYKRAEVLDLIRRLEEIDARLGGDGPRSLHAAFREVVT